MTTNRENREERQRRFIIDSRFWFGVGAGATSLILIVLAFMLPIRFDVFWRWMTDGESGSTTLRNIVILILAIIGMPFAIWRSVVAGRQADTAQRGLRNERYQKAVEMLGNGILAVRLGGIYALQRLTKEDPIQYHIQVMRLFCAFLRHPTQASQSHVPHNEMVEIVGGHERAVNESIRDDVEDVLRAIGTRTKEEIEIESRAGFDLVIYEADLRHLNIRDVTSSTYVIDSKNGLIELNKRRCENLSRIHFRRVDFSNTDLSFTNMSHTTFWDSKFNRARCEEVDLSSSSWEGGTLEEAKLYNADLSNATMSEIDLTTADLSGANLSGVIFKKVNLSGVILRDANLSGTCFSLGRSQEGLWSREGLRQFAPKIEEFCVGVQNITQAQIDEARADPTNPPQLVGVIDSETGKPLVWKGRSTST